MGVCGLQGQDRLLHRHKGKEDIKGIYPISLFLPKREKDTQFLGCPFLLPYVNICVCNEKASILYHELKYSAKKYFILGIYKNVNKAYNNHINSRRKRT